MLSHVPIPDSQIPKDFINLHGHIHNKKLYECIEKYDPSRYSLEKHINISCDVTINISCDVTNFKPISLDEILNLKINK